MASDILPEDTGHYLTEFQSLSTLRTCPPSDAPAHELPAPGDADLASTYATLVCLRCLGPHDIVPMQDMAGLFNLAAQDAHLYAYRRRAACCVCGEKPQLLVRGYYKRENDRFAGNGAAEWPLQCLDRSQKYWKQLRRYAGFVA